MRLNATGWEKIEFLIEIAFGSTCIGIGTSSAGVGIGVFVCLFSLAALVVE